ncbi:hypothetical protein L9F63_000740, partial [Diploptera punctata]
SELISIVSSLWSTGVMSFLGGFLLTSIEHRSTDRSKKETAKKRHNTGRPEHRSTDRNKLRNCSIEEKGYEVQVHIHGFNLEQQTFKHMNPMSDLHNGNFRYYIVFSECWLFTRLYTQNFLVMNLRGRATSLTLQYAATMRDYEEQRTCIKFCFKLAKPIKISIDSCPTSFQMTKRKVMLLLVMKHGFMATIQKLNNSLRNGRVLHLHAPRKPDKFDRILFSRSGSSRLFPVP